MSMKTLADKAMLELNNRMELCTSSLEPSGDEIYWRSKRSAASRTKHRTCAGCDGMCRTRPGDLCVR